MKKIVYVLILAALAFPMSASAQELDPRLQNFLEWEIKDKQVLEETVSTFRDGGMDLETFILVTFTGASNMDSTPDNSLMLSKLGMYIDSKKPSLRPGLLLRMQDFMGDPSNRTMMRGVFMNTVTENIMGK